MAGLIVSWTDRSELEDGFRVEWGTGGVVSQSATVAANVETYTISGLLSNTLCTVQVTATRAGYPDSDILGPVDVYTTPPIAPSGLTATPTGPHGITLAWTLPGIEPISGYKILRADGSEYEAAGTVIPGVSTFSDSNLLDSTSYSYKVVAYNENAAQPDAETAPSNIATATTDAEVTPPNVVGASIDPAGTQISVTFDEAVKIGPGGGGGMTISATGGVATLTYASGDGTSTLVWTISRTIKSGEVVTRSYAQPGNGVEDLAGNDLASFTGQIVTNGSTVVSYLLSEDAEAVGDPAGWARAGTGTTDWDYATSPAPLIGSHSLGISTAGTSTTYDLGVDYTELWVFFHIYTPATGDPNTGIKLLNASNVTMAEVGFRTDRIRGDHGLVNDTLLGAANGQRSVVWIRYVAQSGGGGNGILSVWVNKNSTSEVRPATIDPTITTGTSGAVRKIRLVLGAVAGPVIFDKIRVSTSEIGSSPA